MTFDLDDLIAAPASAVGPAARAVIRVSGDGVRDAVRAVFDPDDESGWNTAKVATRHAGQLRLDELEILIPAAAALWPNRRSYTGQPVVELQIPGSPPLVEAALAALYHSGIRPARPGEFTLRAFLAGRIDLVQAEAVLGVIDANDHRELDVALRQLAGGLSGRLVDVRTDLLNLLADLEAGLDFVDEDITFVSVEQTLSRLASAPDAIDALLRDASDRWIDSACQRVVLAGLPNAGKSTLFNSLVGDDRALVSAVAGTTRDWLMTAVEVDGTHIELIDTAGWEAAADELGVAMQTLRGEQLDRSDLIVWCSAADATIEQREEDHRLTLQLGDLSKRTINIQTKADLSPSDKATDAALMVSVVDGRGLPELRSRIADELTIDRKGSRQMLGSTAARGKQSLEASRDSIERALIASSDGFGDEILAAELRSALDGLAAVLGVVYTDDVLDVLFSRFCIGK